MRKDSLYRNAPTRIVKTFARNSRQMAILMIVITDFDCMEIFEAGGQL